MNKTLRALSALIVIALLLGGCADRYFLSGDPQAGLLVAEGPDSRGGQLTDAAPEPGTEPESESQAVPETEHETQPQTDPETHPLTEPVTQLQTEPVTQPQTEPVTQPQTDPVTQPQTEPVTQPQTDPVTQPQTDPVTQPQTDPVTQPQTEPPAQPQAQPEIVTVSSYPCVVWRRGIADESGNAYPDKLALTLSGLPGKVFTVGRREVSVQGIYLIGGAYDSTLIYEIALNDYTGDRIPEFVIAYLSEDRPGIIRYLIWDPTKDYMNPVSRNASGSSGMYERSDGARFVVPSNRRKLYIAAAEKDSPVLPSIDAGGAYGEIKRVYDDQYHFQLRKGASDQPVIDGAAIVLTFVPDSTGTGYAVSGRRKSSLLEANEILTALPVLEIPSEYNGLPVTEIAAEGFKYGNLEGSATAITKLVIPGSVRVIGRFSFTGLTSLEEVVLEEGVEVIGAEAFFRCESLTKISLPGSLKTIEGRAFGSTGFTSFTVPDSVNEIEELAFANCEKLVTVDLSSSLTAISEGLFAGCTKLASLTVPAGVARIDKGAFSGCESLRSLVFSSGSPIPASSVGIDAFSGCPEEAYPHDHEFVIYREDKGDRCMCRICAIPGIPDESYPVYGDDVPQ